MVPQAIVAYPWSLEARLQRQTSRKLILICSVANVGADPHCVSIISRFVISSHASFWPVLLRSKDKALAVVLILE